MLRGLWQVDAGDPNLTPDATKRRAEPGALLNYLVLKYSDGADVLSFWALASFADFELDFLTLFEVLEAVASDV